jgi:hypothetical protein
MTRLNVYAARSNTSELDHIWEFMSFSSYGMGTQSSGAVQVCSARKDMRTRRQTCDVHTSHVCMCEPERALCSHIHATHCVRNACAHITYGCFCSMLYPRA